MVGVSSWHWRWWELWRVYQECDIGGAFPIERQAVED